MSLEKIQTFKVKFIWKAVNGELILVTSDSNSDIVHYVSKKLQKDEIGITAINLSEFEETYEINPDKL